MIHKPHVDWFALAPTLALLGAAGVAAARGGARPAPRCASRSSAIVCGAGFVAAFVLAILLADKSPHGKPIVADAMFRDRWAATASVLDRRLRRSSRCCISYGERWREEHVGEYYALLAAAGAGMIFFVSASNLMTLFLGLEWFSISLYVLCAIDYDLVGSLEAGLKYLIVGAVGSATLLFGSALVYGATGRARLRQDRRRRRTRTTRCSSSGLAMVIAGLGFKASAAPFHMWTPDVYQGAPTPVTAFMSSATKVAALVVTYRVLVTAFPRRRARSGRGRSRSSRASRSRSATSPRSRSGTSSGCSRTRRSRTRASC